MNKTTNEVYGEVKRLFLEQVDIPKKVGRVQFLLCPIGIIGAGKTTVVKLLAKRLGLVRISGDEIRKMFKDRGFGYERVKELAFEVIKDFLERGFSVVIDSDCISKESQKKIKEVKEKSNLKVIWIHLNPPEIFILKKLSNRATNWLGSAEDMIRNYYQRKPLHQNLDFPFVYTFDISRDDFDTQISEAVAVIYDELKKS